MSNLLIYQKIFHSTFIHSGIRAFFSFCTALLMVLVVRLMGPSEFGKFSLILQLAVTFGLFLSFGSSGMLAKFLPELKDTPSQARLSSQLIEVSFIAVTIFTLVFLFIYNFYPSILPLEIKSAKVPFILFVSLFAFFNVFQGIFRGLGQFIRWSLIEGSNDFLARGLTLLFIWVLSPNYSVALYAYLFMLALSCLYSCILLRKQFRLVDLKIDPQVTRFSMVMLAGAVIFMAGTSLDAILLRALLKDTKEVGYYFAGVRVPQIFQSLLLAPLSIPFVYYFTHPDTLHTRDQIIRIGMKVLGVICGLGSLFLFSFGGHIITFFYGNLYSDSIMVLRTYAFIFFLVAIQALFGPFFMAINKLHLQQWVGAISVALLLVLDYYFIPVWKSTGAALANVVMLTFQNICYTYILMRNQLNIVRITTLLFVGMLASVLLELFWMPYASIPFFLIFVVVVRLFSVDELKKIRQVLFEKQETGAV